MRCGKMWKDFKGACVLNLKLPLRLPFYETQGIKYDKVS